MIVMILTDGTIMVVEELTARDLQVARSLEETN